MYKYVDIYKALKKTQYKTNTNKQIHYPLSENIWHTLVSSRNKQQQINNISDKTFITKKLKTNPPSSSKNVRLMFFLTLF